MSLFFAFLSGLHLCVCLLALRFRATWLFGLPFFEFCLSALFIFVGVRLFGSFGLFMLFGLFGMLDCLFVERVSLFCSSSSGET